MRMASGLAAALATMLALTVSAPPAEAKVDKCERACRVVFARGRSNCQVKVKKGIKLRQNQCKTDWQSSGFSNLQKCRTAARKFGLALIKATCKGPRLAQCQSCCSSGGTKETCAPKSPSGAFLTLDGALQ